MQYKVDLPDGTFLYTRENQTPEQALEFAKKTYRPANQFYMAYFYPTVLGAVLFLR